MFILEMYWEIDSFPQFDVKFSKSVLHLIAALSWCPWIGGLAIYAYKQLNSCI